MGKFMDSIFTNIFEPALVWVLNHPIISVAVVGLLIFISVRNYRML